MELERLLDRARQLEERAAAVYRIYAASARIDPPVCALWTDLARDEEAHARSLASAKGGLAEVTGRLLRVNGWEEALDEIEERLAAAERLGPDAGTDRQLSAALALEMTELEGLRHLLLELSRCPEDEARGAHAERLADQAARFSQDLQVTLQAALLRARARARPRPAP